MVKLARYLGIECNTKRAEVTISFRARGVEYGKLRINSVHVYFPNDQIDRIAQSLKDHLNSNGVPA